MTYKNDKHTIKIVGDIIIIDGEAFPKDNCPIKEYKIKGDVLSYKTNIFHTEKLNRIYNH